MKKFINGYLVDDEVLQIRTLDLYILCGPFGLNFDMRIQWIEDQIFQRKGCVSAEEAIDRIREMRRQLLILDEYENLFNKISKISIDDLQNL